MLVSVIGRYAEAAEREVDRYAGWLTALRQLRSDWETAGWLAVARLPGFLQSVPPEYRPEAVQDLVAEHLRFAWQAGRGSPLEVYLQELAPDLGDLASPATVPADLVEDEFLARYLPPHGDTPAPEEYEQRFPGRPDVMKLLRSRCLDGGRYVKLRKRGQGAMGVVWEAYDRHLCRRVAVKEPGAAQAASADLRDRFTEEAHVTAGLEHPGIVGVYEYHPDREGTPFYVMRLVDGRTLAERIRDYHQPPPDRDPGEQRLLWYQLLHSLVAVCDAMAYAHARGVVHRDLKPGNIVVGEFGEAVILDWGMSKRITAAASDGSDPERAPCVVVGTPQYMPPEQADGLADPCSDVFGLGAILYEMLTGQAPHAWAANVLPEDWRRIVREARFSSPRSLNPRSPRALEAICLKALAPKPADRYSSAAQLAQDVRRFLAGEPVTVWVEPVSVKVRRWLGLG